MADEEQQPQPPVPAWPPPYQGYPPPPYPGYAPPPHQGYQPYPAYAAYPVQPTKPSFPHDRPRPYHQILRNWDYAAWRSVVGILLVVLGFLVIAPIIALPVLFIGIMIEGGDFLNSLEAFGRLEEITPSSMLYLNVTLGSAILVTWVAIRVLHGMRPRWLASVAPKLRWNFLMACLGVSVVALIASILVSLLIPTSAGDADLNGTLNDFTATSAWIALIVLLTTPFQAAGEEYVFRGYLLQAIGSFVDRDGWKWVAIIITSLLFAMAHGLQNFPLFFDRFMFGMIAGWLTIRTGGLEAGIAMHILNNYLAFGFALAFGDLSESLSVSEVSWWNILVTLTQALVYAGLVVVVARAMKVQRTTRPPAPAAPPPPVPAPAAGFGG
ncbi:MAG TPA: CPBP family intramembrane glutamic endopeptidase [Nocardioidaceae bacterium]|nr:CPBP family intramembrane glutamic endopeptidase [Nocardioidaceae bacterium]